MDPLHHFAKNGEEGPFWLQSGYFALMDYDSNPRSQVGQWRIQRGQGPERVLFVAQGLLFGSKMFYFGSKVVILR